MFVYLIVNNVTGKYYVGQHKGDNLQHYLQQKFYEAEHCLKTRSHLYASMRKHGRDVFSIHPLKSGIQTREELDKWEKYFIGLLSSRHPDIGYNICRGGEGFTGPHTEETKEKIGRASKSRGARPPVFTAEMHSDEWKQKMSQIMKNKRHKPPTPGTGVHNQVYRQDISDDEIIALYASGLATNIIATKLRTSSATIWKRLKKHGIKTARKHFYRKVSDFVVY